MSSRPPSRRSHAARCLAALLALAAAAPADAVAQDIFSDLFGGIFGGGGRSRRPAYDRPPREYREQRYEREPRHVRQMAPHVQPQRRVVSRPAATQKDGEATTPRVEKSEAQIEFHVAVLGDAFSVMLADGLDQTFADAPKIGVFRKGKDNSGLVRADYFDWIKAAQEIAAGAPKPDVAVIMIGGNDRQAMGEDSAAREPLSPRWREIYEGRVDSLIQSFKEKNIPVIWVGLPIMQPAGYSATIAQINEIFRASAAKADVPFVDLWDKFADERGQYAAFGPDVSGQIVKLRSADGIHFTKAGARKLALFVEGEVRRIYDARQNGGGEAAAPAQPAAPQAGAPPAPAAPAQPVVFQPPAETAGRPAAPSLPAGRPPIGPVQPLNAAQSAPSDDLLRADAKAAAQKAGSIERAVAAHVFVQGGEQPARPGRADDFRARQPPPAPTTPQ